MLVFSEHVSENRYFPWKHIVHTLFFSKWINTKRKKKLSSVLNRDTPMCNVTTTGCYNNFSTGQSFPSFHSRLILSRNLLSLQLNYMKKVSLSKLLQRSVNFISEELITLSYKQRKTCEEWYKLRLSVKILFQRELWIQPLSPINMAKIPVCPKKQTSQYVC